MSEKKIGIFGSGLIGRSWAMLFAGAGYKVCLYDIVPKQVETAVKEIAIQLESLEKSKLLRGKLSAKEQVALISGTTDLAECVKETILVQECTPETLEIKMAALTSLDVAIKEPTIISSSTSTHMPSVLSKNLKNKERFAVAHPSETEIDPVERMLKVKEAVMFRQCQQREATDIRYILPCFYKQPRVPKNKIFVNPPYYVRLVEIVPAPWTEPWVPIKIREIMEELGQAPVSLKHEVPGFSLNRIQYAILNEAWRQVEDNVLDVKDVDIIMSEGLGPRYAFLGSLEVAHLNAEGMENYCERYAKTINSVSLDMGPVPFMSGETMKKVDQQLKSYVPVENLVERRKWRDTCLTRLAMLKKEMNNLPETGLKK